MNLIDTKELNITQVHGVNSYPELFAKSYNESESEVRPCTRSYKHAKCNCGESYLKSIVCGKEYCPDCGKNESDIHLRRVARWWPKVFSLSKVGYLVVSIPANCRDFFKNRDVLKEFRRFLIRKLKRMGYSKGLCRWHWFGDCRECGNKEGRVENCSYCQGTGAGRDWNPHLNFFIEQGFMEEPFFSSFCDNLKISVKNWIELKFKISGISGNIHFKFCSFKEQKIHKLYYVTRATFRHYSREIAELLHGFRNNVVWGTFEKCEQQPDEPSELISLEKGLCPCCGDFLHWEPGLVKRESLREFIKIKISGGYFQLIKDG